MNSFLFQTCPRILCETGGTAQIGALLAEMGASKAAFVTDAGILELGLAEDAISSIKAAGLGIWMFSEVTADPPQSMILAAVEGARAAGVDAVVSVGGGSSLDTAKLVALLLGSSQSLPQIYGVGLAKGKRLPLILAPTTAGTGSEVTPISIVTTGENEKKGVVAPQLLPDIAILDAALTIGLPAHVTAATGIDAMVHAIEAFTSRRLKNPMSDVLAQEALRLLGANIRSACNDPGNLDVRSRMLLGSMLAGMAFANAPVAAVHALAYPLGGQFHIPHGHSNALVLPHVLRFNLQEAKALYDTLAPLVFADANQSKSPADAMIAGFEALGPELGLETRLSGLGVTPADVPALARDAMKQERLLINNPREMTLEAAQAIYEAAM